MSPELIRSYIERQQCWVCGRGPWVALIQHLCKSHQLYADDVRDMAYLLKSDSLISNELSDIMRQSVEKKLGGRRGKSLKGVPHVLTIKGKDRARALALRIRPLTFNSHIKQRKPHPCEQCGVIIPKGKRRLCSANCFHLWMSQHGKKVAQSPRQIEFFNSIRRIPTPEQSSLAGKAAWEYIRALPELEQVDFFKRRCSSRIHKAKLKRLSLRPEVCRLRGDGLTYAEVGKILNISASYAFKICMQGN